MEHVATTLVVSWRGVAKARQKRVHRLPKERFTLANVERVPSKSITTKVFYFPSPYPNSKPITSTHRLVIQPSKHYLEMVIFQPVLTQRDCFNAMKFRPERFHVVTKRRGYFKMAT